MPAHNKAHQLLNIVTQEIKNAPVERDGLMWAAKPLAWYCTRLSISAATLGRIISGPPFMRLRVKLDGRVITLLREHEPNCITPTHAKNLMRKVWTEKTGRRLSPKEIGCLYGLVDVWSEETPLDAVDTFKLVIHNWGAFMTGAKIEISNLGPKGQWRFYEYPSLTVIRRFASVGIEMKQLQKQSGATGLTCYK